jgi:hypothetical protein
MTGAGIEEGALGGDEALTPGGQAPRGRKAGRGRRQIRGRGGPLQEASLGGKPERLRGVRGRPLPGPPARKRPVDVPLEQRAGKPTPRPFPTGARRG